MVSLISSTAHHAYVQNPTSSLSFSPFASILPAFRRRRRFQLCCERTVDFGCKRGGRFAVLKEGSVRSRSNSSNCWCKKGDDSEGDSELEGKILEFMAKSNKPDSFPTKQELVNAGRLDLVEAIRRRGGWFTLGWEVDGREKEGDKVKESEIRAVDIDVEDFRRRRKNLEEGGFSGEAVVASSGGDTFSGDPSQMASSSGRPLEIVTVEEVGVEGILSRLEKERNSSFGINLENFVSGSYTPRKADKDIKRSSSLADADRVGLDKNGSLISSVPNGDMLNSHYTRPDMWRAWSDQRAGFHHIEFEAAEIVYDRKRGEREGRKNDMHASKDTIGHTSRHKDFNCEQMRSRLYELEVELSSALHALRSKREESFLKEVPGSPSSELQRLSDAWEFQENEIMNAQDRLRSVRAKLTVLEGKMALAIIDAKAILEEKQKRIEVARKALQLLRTTRIVWSNPASEVLLAGSFDSWTTQRKMEKSSSGIFSVYLKLYPGRYEIKFIVDGVWRVDPLRPIVNNSGHENNLLIIT